MKKKSDKRHRILCVDDESDNLDLLDRSLGGRYDVLLASCGEEALNQLRNERVSLIITDQRMPGMSGTDLLTLALKYSPETVRTILTGYRDVGDLIRAVNSGKVFHVLLKPWKIEALLQVVDNAIAQYTEWESQTWRLATLSAENEELRRRISELEKAPEGRVSVVDALVQTNAEAGQDTLVDDGWAQEKVGAIAAEARSLSVPISVLLASPLGHPVVDEASADVAQGISRALRLMLRRSDAVVVTRSGRCIAILWGCSEPAAEMLVRRLKAHAAERHDAASLLQRTEIGHCTLKPDDDISTFAKMATTEETDD